MRKQNGMKKEGDKEVCGFSYKNDEWPSYIVKVSISCRIGAVWCVIYLGIAYYFT